MLDGAYVDGPADAKILIVEYSDFQCPFCKRHSVNGTIDQVIEKYEGDVAMTFQHFPLNFHPLAQKAGEGAECVADQGGADAFYAFKKNLFNEAQPDEATVLKVAGAIDGIDADAVKDCLDAGTHDQKVKDQMAFGRTKFGVTGTPGNIVLNVETGEFVKVSGAVPASAFDSAVASLME